MNSFFGMSIVIGVMLVGLDFIARSAGPQVHAGYRRTLGRIFDSVRRQTLRLLRWSWRNYRQAIIGFFVGAVTALYLTGHSQ